MKLSPLQRTLYDAMEQGKWYDEATLNALQRENGIRQPRTLYTLAKKGLLEIRIEFKGSQPKSELERMLAYLDGNRADFWRKRSAPKADRECCAVASAQIADGETGRSCGTHARWP